MLDINLTPYEELEDKYWYLLEVIGAVFAATVFYVLATMWMQDMKEELSVLESDTKEYEANIENLKAGRTKIEDIEKRIEELEKQIAVYKGITTSQFTRFEALIVMEMMHSLKPSGMWYEDVKIDSESKSVEVSGLVNNMSLMANFVTSLRSTQDGDPDDEDLRSKLMFRNIRLNNFNREDFALASFPAVNSHKFAMSMSYRER